MPAYLKEPALDLPTSEMAPIRRGNPVELALIDQTKMMARSIDSMNRCAAVMAQCVATMMTEEVREPVLEEWEVEVSPPAQNGAKKAKFRRTK